MVENTKIEWADDTFNAWIGCSKVSPGCEHCYAETLMDTRYNKVKWGPNGARVRTSEANWKKPLTWNRKAAKDGVRRRVFCSSLSDVFENRNELIPWRQQLFRLIGQTPNLDWLILTKRPENVMHFAFQQQLWWPSDSIPGNVWIGTSVEDQKRADERIPHLLKIPAAVRFLSMEPLLGPVDLVRWMPADRANWQCQKCGSFQRDETYCLHCRADVAYLSGSHVANKKTPNTFKGHINRQPIDWVIVGGESGQGARPCAVEWIRSIRGQCDAAGVPCFIKQLGARPTDTGTHLDWPEGTSFRRDSDHGNGARVILSNTKGGDWDEWPEDLRVREFPCAHGTGG